MNDSVLPLFSVVIPVYMNELNIPALLDSLGGYAKSQQHRFRLECVFVIDGSPDRSQSLLEEQLARRLEYAAQLHVLSRNFGSPAAIQCGLGFAKGDCIANFSADLQEPLSLLTDFFDILDSGEADVCFGARTDREDPFFSRLSSGAFWFLYRLMVDPKIPPGGFDIFGCTEQVRDELVRLQENNTFLIGLLFWLGFRKKTVPYHRRQRQLGKSSWTLRKKARYLLDSTFSFTDLPIKALLGLGAVGISFSVLYTGVLLYARFTEGIPVPGFSATIVVISFFGGINSLGLGIVGEYLYRTYENTKARPNSVVMESREYPLSDREAV